MYQYLTKHMKIAVLLLLMFPMTGVQATNEDSDIILHLKKKYYNENNVSEYSEEFMPNKIYATEADMNGDGTKEVGLIYSGFCGAGAYTCNWVMYSLVSGSYCEIGSLASEYLSSVKNEPRTYKCRTKENTLDLDQHGNQMTKDEIDQASQAQHPAPDEQQTPDAPVVTDKPPFKFAMEGIKNAWKWYSITSEMDGLTINELTVNRNAKNCESFLWANANGVVADPQASKKASVLGFGETAIYLVSNRCSAIEISVKANSKEWIYTER